MARHAIEMNSVKSIIFRWMFAICDACVKLLLSRKVCMKVRSGPFEGMCYGVHAVGSVLTPKLLGTYEKELAAVIEHLPVFDLVIDIGAAEGWYAVGLLYRKIARKVVAFELTDSGQKACRDTAGKNAVAGRLEVRGKCTVDELRLLLCSLPRTGYRVLIISDCEGYENELFTADMLKLCRKAHLIIETHDSFVPGTHMRLAQELDSSHIVTHIQPVRRSRSDIISSPANPAPWWLRISVIRRLLLLERRGPGIAWIYAVPKIEFE
jgi:hypothetical protein